jgi:hypothetical protein
MFIVGGQQDNLCICDREIADVLLGTQEVWVISCTLSGVKYAVVCKGKEEAEREAYRLLGEGYIVFVVYQMRAAKHFRVGTLAEFSTD